MIEIAKTKEFMKSNCLLPVLILKWCNQYDETILGVVNINFHIALNCFGFVSKVFVWWYLWLQNMELGYLEKLCKILKFASYISWWTLGKILNNNGYYKNNILVYMDTAGRCKVYSLRWFVRAEVHSQLSQTSRMELFGKRV